MGLFDKFMKKKEEPLSSSPLGQTMTEEVVIPVEPPAVEEINNEQQDSMESTNLPETEMNKVESSSDSNIQNMTDEYPTNRTVEEGTNAIIDNPLPAVPEDAEQISVNVNDIFEGGNTKEDEITNLVSAAVKEALKEEYQNDLAEIINGTSEPAEEEEKEA